jgi:hypothetical protein
LQGSNLSSSTAQAVVHTWTPSTRKLDVYRVQGTFANASTITGVTSNSSWTLSGTIDNDAFDNNIFEDIVDNTRIQTEADEILDFSETNPFGEP